jgi:hypothetical protein
MTSRRVMVVKESSRLEEMEVKKVEEEDARRIASPARPPIRH